MTVDVLVLLRVTVTTEDDTAYEAHERAIEQARRCADMATAPTVIVSHVTHIDAQVDTVAVVTP